MWLLFYTLIRRKEIEKIKDTKKNEEKEVSGIIQSAKKYIDEHYADEAHGTLNMHYLDITPSGCTKGTGISNLVSLLNEDVVSYAIGDSYNDISMFEHADHGYTFNKQVDYLSELIDEMLK